MDAIEALMFYQLPPAGNPVMLSSGTDQTLPEFLSAAETAYYASGTAALAAAVSAALRFKNIDDAEVILPAYGCPDLVSAVIHAGARPILVDLQAERPWLDLDQCAAAINENTAAIVGVNLFGIAERWPQLRALAEKNSLVLIEDSAQYFPGKDSTPEWSGDLVVFSFGRGKPVSLLGGGAVVCRHEVLSGLLNRKEAQPVSALQRLSYALKGRLYNAMISPLIYWLPQSLPFLHLGETRYHTLREIGAMDPGRKALLPANVKRYQDDAHALSRCRALSSMLAGFEQVIDLPSVCEMAEDRRLLRYPVLLKKDVRDAVVVRLQRAGAGISKMYPASMPNIDGLEDMFSGQSYPAAEDFSARIITLPTHAKLGSGMIAKIGNQLKVCFS